MASRYEEHDGDQRRAPPEHGRRLSRSSSLHKMLNTIISERRKEQNIDEQFVLVTSPDVFWTSIFSKYFINSDHNGNEGSRDDLLFFVRNKMITGNGSTPSKRFGSSNSLASESMQDDTVQVFRRDSKNLPGLGDPQFNWEETVYLNLILQQFEYTLTCAVCSRTGDRELQILKKCSQKVYASPSKREMESKGSEEIMAYPDIFFTVDNFEEAFTDILVRDSEMVCVELVATDRNGDFQAVIFLGSIRYEALKTVFDNKNSVTNKMMQSFTWGTQRISSQRTEFIRMRGPHGKGYAEMAISRQKGVPDTPMTTPLSTPATTPGATPEREDLPPFPPTEQSSNEQNTYNNESRRYSDTGQSTSSPFRNGFKWGFGIRKSQSATEQMGNHMSNNQGEVEAKSISDELHHSGTGLLGKSFGQAWHWFKEQRRAASVGLNSYLTYVTLPWHRIIADVLDKQRTPVLSF